MCVCVCVCGERDYVNIDEFKLGGLQEKHEVTSWNLGTLSELL